MQFIDKDICLTVSEPTEQGEVTISMENVTEPEHSYLNIDLTGVELVRLRDWIIESVEILKKTPE